MSSTSTFSCRPAPVSDKRLPRRLPFTKMQGLGNDYIYVEEFTSPLADPAPLAVAVSDRHFGVGGDGLVLIGLSDRADFRMRIFNADGSEAEMCGNATRCIGKYLYEKGLTTKTEITLETLAGIRILALNTEGSLVRTVRVQMGRPILTPADIPMEAEGESFIDQDILVDGTSFRGTAVSMGNPHLVIPVPKVADFNLQRFGPPCERHPWFPKRVNTEFVEIINRKRIRMRVWERGSGETLACGTGACAALTAGVLNGWTERAAVLELRGGELEIEWAGDGAIYMTGGATFVFSGEYIIGS
ncbi:MAG: diaminopimelate epimerase [Desulfovibrio sp.]|nr:diaminopimelate epimerase [Desulfovibrio sp.]